MEVIGKTRTNQPVFGQGGASGGAGHTLVVNTSNTNPTPFHVYFADGSSIYEEGGVAVDTTYNNATAIVFDAHNQIACSSPCLFYDAYSTEKTFNPMFTLKSEYDEEAGTCEIGDADFIYPLGDARIETIPV